ncbi:MAG: class E sortase [Bifidobacteriaceae bacterium]|jgi:LPXTG-site transpeptidase (sortase) family protein|nr:class E sortase [Bifidobacteriaceae bacterium]
MTVSALILAFVAHAAVLSGLQHRRAQLIAYGELRSTLAKAETPVGQLDYAGEMVAPGTPIALLEIPAIGLTEVIREGSSAEVLRGGAGHRRDSAIPGQAGTAVLLGRHTTYGGPFGRLALLVPGDTITLTTGQGLHTYRMVALRRAGDPLPAPLRAGQSRLELLTADGPALFATDVLHADAELISDVRPAAAKVMAYPALPAAEQAMGQDTSALFTAFFNLAIFAAAGIGLWWAWRTWGRWHAWFVGVPVLLALGAAGSDTLINVLPNLL